MATIIENLKKILEARYGKDVRQAIHDSIENCYNDGKAGSIDLQARQMLGDTNISSIADGTVTGSVKTLSDEATENESAISEVNSKLGNTDISAIGDGTVTGGLNALNSNLDRINSKIIYRDVTITGDSIKPGGDISLFCDIPSGYTPLSVEDISSSMVINGMLSSVGIYAGRAITRFHNLSSSYVSIANQVLRFWFIYNS